MTPHEFVAKWRDANLSERAAAQSHFVDLCRLIGQPDPIAADPAGEWFTFEKGTRKASGGRGWADVWRRGCFAWEYKRKGADLAAAHRQLLNYSGVLENPPLLIVSDSARIRLHANWTYHVPEVHEIGLDDLLDGAKRDLLSAAFTEPERLRPAKTRQALTEQAAEKFVALAQRLRERGHDAQAVAHFVNRLVFCMFAEDVGLLPRAMFQRMLEAAAVNPADFAGHARTLFAAMQDGGMVGFERVEWFNGGLFDTDEALPLEKADLGDVLAAARLDWSAIDPAILGTLFERGLDPAKRSQLGAHYTDRDKIKLIVDPVIVRPLRAEWEEVRGRIEAALSREKAARSPSAATRAHNEAVTLHAGFVERLKNFRVLDPACGSGNFLYLALLALKDLEHRTNLEAEALGLPRGFPSVGPECVKGIEINPFAAELARVSVWIGEIQWMRRNGFDAAKNPILRPLDTIECRDAILNADGTRAEWPETDVVVGNPPFLGTKRMYEGLGVDYAKAVRAAYARDVSPFSDLVCWWFAKAREEMDRGRLARAGLVATNSIRGGKNRLILDRIAERGIIYNAWSDEPWIVEGAAVRVSIVIFDAEKRAVECILNGAAVHEIFPDLTPSGGTGGPDLTKAKRLPENKSRAFVGTVKAGAFDLHGEQAREMLLLPTNPNGLTNSDVLVPWMNGLDVVRRPQGKWIIDFGLDMPLCEAQLFEAPFGHVEEHVKPKRATVKRARYRDLWWLQAEPCGGMRKAVARLNRFIATPALAKHRVFVWLSAAVQPDHQLIVIARDDDTAFGILHSRFHELWSLRMGTSLEDRPRYTPSTTFETFPFPEGLTPDIPAADYTDDPRARAIAAAAAELNRLRENWLNPADLVRRVPEVVPGYPDRILPVDDAAAAVLKKRTLTNLYNQRPAWLEHAHAALDRAVADAYGWGEDLRAGRLDDDAILGRLFELNRARAAG